MDQNGRSVRAKGKYVSSARKTGGPGCEGLGLGLGQGESDEGSIEFGSPVPHDTTLTLGRQAGRQERVVYHNLLFLFFKLSLISYLFRSPPPCAVPSHSVPSRPASGDFIRDTVPNSICIVAMDWCCGAGEGRGEGEGEGWLKLLDLDKVSLCLCVCVYLRLCVYSWLSVCASVAVCLSVFLYLWLSVCLSV